MNVFVVAPVSILGMIVASGVGVVCGVGVCGFGDGEGRGGRSDSIGKPLIGGEEV